jgi:DUF4097 and DUF4098 domain-containing protein YvlB
MVIGLGMMAVSAASAKNDYKQLIKTENVEEKTYDIEESFDNIEIGVGMNDLIVKRSEDKAAHFFCTETERIKYNVEVKNNTLYIKEKNNKTLINIVSFANSPSNVLYLPKDTYESVTGTLGSGDIIIDEAFSFADLSLKVGSGDVKISNVKCQNLFKAHTGSGAINATSVTSEGSFEATTGSGRIELTSCVGTTVELKTGSGRIVFDDCDGTDLKMSTGSGDIRGTLRTGKAFTTKAGSGDVIVPSGTKENGTCEVKTGSGDIEISVP